MSEDFDFIAALARELTPGDFVHVGASQSEVLLAVELARRTGTVNLRVTATGAFHAVPVPTRRASDRTYSRDIMASRLPPLNQSSFFADLWRSRVVFAGAMEIDRHGNANLSGVTTADGRIIKGPGGAGLPTLTTWSERFYLVAGRHDPRHLVERVQNISVLGDPVERRRLGLPAGLVAVITPLARFVPGENGLVVDQLAEGVSRDEVRERTGFVVEFDDDLMIRPAAGETESDILRELGQHSETTK